MYIGRDSSYCRPVLGRALINLLKRDSKRSSNKSSLLVRIGSVFSFVYSHRRRARCWRGWIRLFIQQIMVSSPVKGGELEVNSAILALMAAWSADIFATGFRFHEGKGVPRFLKAASPCSLLGGTTSLH